MRLNAKLAISVLVLGAFRAEAQQENRYLLLGGGLNLSTFFRTTDLEDVKWKDESFRPGLGVQVGYQSTSGDIGETVVTFGYETRGAVINGDLPGEPDVTFRFNYAQVALGSKFLLPLSGGASLYLMPGIGLALCLNSDVSDGTVSSDLSEANPFDLDLSIALGTQVPVGRNAFYLEGGYCFGVVNTVPDAQHLGMRNVNLKFRLGYLVAF